MLLSALWVDLPFFQPRKLKPIKSFKFCNLKFTSILLEKLECIEKFNVFTKCDWWFMCKKIEGQVKSVYYLTSLVKRSSNDLFHIKID